MNLLQFLIEFTTEKLAGEKSSRRDMFGTLGSLGKKAVMSSIPMGLAAIPAKTYAQDSGNAAVDTLQLA